MRARVPNQNWSCLGERRTPQVTAYQVCTHTHNRDLALAFVGGNEGISKGSWTTSLAYNVEQRRYLELTAGKLVHKHDHVLREQTIVYFHL